MNEYLHNQTRMVPECPCACCRRSHTRGAIMPVPDLSKLKTPDDLLEKFRRAVEDDAGPALKPAAEWVWDPARAPWVY